MLNPDGLLQACGLLLTTRGAGLSRALQGKSSFDPSAPAVMRTVASRKVLMSRSLRKGPVSHRRQSGNGQKGGPSIIETSGVRIPIRPFNSSLPDNFFCLVRDKVVS